MRNRKSRKRKPKLNKPKVKPITKAQDITVTQEVMPVATGNVEPAVPDNFTSLGGPIVTICIILCAIGIIFWAAKEGGKKPKPNTPQQKSHNARNTRLPRMRTNPPPIGARQNLMGLLITAPFPLKLQANVTDHRFDTGEGTQPRLIAVKLDMNPEEQLDTGKAITAILAEYVPELEHINTKATTISGLSGKKFTYESPKGIVDGIYFQKDLALWIVFSIAHHPQARDSGLRMLETIQAP